jgi:hypothetical protein
MDSTLIAQLLRQHTDDNAWEKEAQLKRSLMPSEFQQAVTPMDFKVNASPPIQGMQNGQPDYGFGNRYNSNMPKDTGFYGLVARPDGVNVSTELSINNGHGEIPSMVPGLTPNELQSLLTAKEDQQFPESVYRKAESYSNFRRLLGKSPFAGINDQPQLLPSRNGTLISDLLRGGS